MRFMPVRMNEGFHLFDDVFSTPFFTTEALMKTDITEKDGICTLKMDIPGYEKSDVKISLDSGNLTIEASRNSDNEEKDEKGRVIRHERYSGSCSRTFYVGTQVGPEDIHADFADGILTIEMPSVKEQKTDSKYYIDID